jgi:hypothetical protein
LVKQYELPTFFGLTICITGFSDSELAQAEWLYWLY